jgi:hypothetical protein
MSTNYETGDLGKFNSPTNFKMKNTNSEIYTQNNLMEISEKMDKIHTTEGNSTGR